MIWNTDYLNLYISARKNLDYKNIESLSSSQINHIGKMYNKKDFAHYKKKVFFRWFSENVSNDLPFLRRAKKLIKRLDIALTELEWQKVDNIEAREFTKRRSLKTIEVPYKDDKQSVLLQPNAIFFYKDIRTYYKKLNMFDIKYHGEIYITSKEIVLYNRDEKFIDMIIHHEDIDKIILTSYCIELKLKRKDSIYFRYKDNELIYISLNRSINLKKNIEFKDISRDDGDTAERTMELVLNIGETKKGKKSHK